MFALLPSPREMAFWDHAAVQLGLPEMLLMEHAGKSAVQALQTHSGTLKGKRALLFMGAGNNGGDAACMARHLLDAGAEVLVLHTRPLNHYKGVSGQHLRLARRCGVTFAPAATWPDGTSASWKQPSIVVDGLLGTGFSGLLREQERQLVEAMNVCRRAGSFVLSLDIPSGLNGLTGLPCPVAVQADATATFAAAKPGLVMPDAVQYVGKLHICDIAMPRRVQENAPCSFRLMLPALLECIPKADHGWHKGRAGHVFIVGGSRGLSGAPQLAAYGALRAGAGLVTVASPACSLPTAGIAPDIMTLELEDDWAGGIGRLSDALKRADSLAIGPGMGRTQEAADALKELLNCDSRPPAVLDADALALFAEHPEMLALVRDDDVLTPHPGEAAMLLGISSAAVQANRLGVLEQLSRRAPGIWVLKGAGTLVRRGEGVVSVCSLSAPNLAVGGSGDVLAGSIATLLAQKVESEMAACVGVYRHACAGQLLAADFPRRGNSATEIADALPRV